MNIALLGLPLAGKKTLFSLLTGRTIPPGRKAGDAIEGRAPVRDPRVDAIARIAQPQKIRYAETAFLLCPDVQDGEQDGAWLNPARRSDMLCLVIRAFGAAEGGAHEGGVDAERDRQRLETELLLADLALIERRLERMGREARGKTEAARATEERTLRKCAAAIEAGKWPETIGLSEPEKLAVKSLGLLTLKPVLRVYNVAERDLGTLAEGRLAVACRIEREIMELEDAEARKAFLKDLGLSASGLDRLNSAAYERLGLMSFYTMGPDEVRAWTIRQGATAPEAGGKIHSDIERGFIRVEVIKYDDLMAAGSEAAVRAMGKVQLRGKDYVMQDGDICCFRFNV